MRPPLPVVRLATFEDAEPIADLLADAFLDYEWSRWAVPADDRRERLRGLHLLYAGLVGAEMGSTWVTDDISSVVNWVMPGPTPISESFAPVSTKSRLPSSVTGSRRSTPSTKRRRRSAPPGPTGTSRPSARDRTAGVRAWPRWSSAPAWPPAIRPASRRRSRPRTKRTAASTSAWASRPPATEPRLTAGCGSGSWSGRQRAEQRSRSANRRREHTGCDNAGQRRPAARDQALHPQAAVWDGRTPRLVERMDRGAESKLTLISAPPGFGKTTLLVGWLSADPALPLARLRVRGELVEIHAADLRFTPGETAAFFGDDRSIGRRPAGTLQGPSQRSDSGGELRPWSIRG